MGNHLPSAIDPDYKKILQLIADTVCISNKEGILLFVSASCNDLFGYSAEEMTGKHFSQFIHPADLPAAEQLNQLCSPTFSTVHFESRFHKKDGTVVPVFWSAKWHDDDQLLYCVARDGTEKTELYQRLNEAQKVARVGNFEFDLIARRYTYWPEGLRDILGLAQSDVEAFTEEQVLNMIHPEDKERVRLHVRQALQNAAQHPIAKVEFRIVRPGGQVADLCVFGEITLTQSSTPSRITGTILDMTEQKSRELLIRQSEERFRCLVQDGSDLFTIIDKNGQFIFVSDNVFDILGYSPNEMLGRTSFEFVHPDDIDVAGEQHSQVLKNQDASTRSVQHRFLHKNGSWVWFDAVGANHLRNPSINGIVVVSRNIDGRIKLQNQLNQALITKQKEITAAVIQAQENERAQLSQELHDNVNQVLTTVKLYNEMCLAGGPGDNAILKKAVQYTQDCINEIRSISRRLSAPALDQFPLHDALEELVVSLNATKRVTIRLTVTGISREVITERLYIAIYRIVQEGLNNIIKYSQATEAFIELQASNGKLWLKITDNGVGFDLSAKRGGIGLKNMRTRAESLDAAFYIDTAPGKGCAIEIGFPFAE